MLHDVAPDCGVAVLFYKHDVADASFPLAIAAGDRTERISIEGAMERYYLFATTFASTEIGAELELKTETQLSQIVRLGKLIAHFSLTAPVRVRIRRVGNGDRLTLVQAWPGSTEPPPEISGRKSSAIEHLTKGWVFVNRAYAVSSTRDTATVASSIESILSDRFSSPPYLPCLHGLFRIDSSEAQLTLPVVNPLGYNCVLNERRNKLREAYVDEMFRKLTREATFKDDLSNSDDPIAKAVAGHTLDVVVKACWADIGPKEKNQSVILALRANMPRDAVGKADPWLQERMNRLTGALESPLAVVSRGMDELGNAPAPAVAVTAWIGEVQDGEVRDAFPLGFAPGSAVATLEQLVDDEELDRQHFSWTIETSGARLSLVQCQPGLLQAGSTEWQRELETMVETLGRMLGSRRRECVLPLRLFCDWIGETVLVDGRNQVIFRGKRSTDFRAWFLAELACNRGTYIELRDNLWKEKSEELRKAAEYVTSNERLKALVDSRVRRALTDLAGHSTYVYVADRGKGWRLEDRVQADLSSAKFRASARR